MRLQQNENGFQQVKIDFSSAHQVAHVNVKVQSQLELGFLCCSPRSFREAGRACRQSKLSRELPWELVPAWGRGAGGDAWTAPALEGLACRLAAPGRETQREPGPTPTSAAGQPRSVPPGPRVWKRVRHKDSNLYEE